MFYLRFFSSFKQCLISKLDFSRQVLIAIKDTLKAYFCYRHVFFWTTT